MKNIEIAWKLEKTELDGYIQYLYQQERSAATIEKYVRDVRTFFDFIGADDIQVDKKKLLEYKEWLAERYAVSSANSMIAALNNYLEYLEYPMLKLKSFRIQKRLFIEKELTNKEYRKLVETAVNQGKNQTALIIETICATGIRVSELCYFTIENLKKRKIQINNKGKIRMILLPDAIVKKILYYAGKAGIKNGPVFLTKNGRIKDRSNIWKEMKKIADAAGVAEEKVFPHNLRHLFARTFYAQTKNLAALADLLGHSSLEVTRIYTSETLESFRGIIDRMGLITVQLFEAKSEEQ